MKFDGVVWSSSPGLSWEITHPRARKPIAAPAFLLGQQALRKLGSIVSSY